jgi:molybdopterin converting factor small subunit
LARVFFPKSLQVYTSGIEEIEVEAGEIRELFGKLELRFPELKGRLRSGLAIAIDGEIISDPLLEVVGSESEIHFLPPISGG